MKKIVVFCMVLSTILVANAGLNLQLLHSARKTTTIAIVKFSGSKIVSNDLKYSGRFQVINTTTTHDANYWHKSKVQNVLLVDKSGKIKLLGAKDDFKKALITVSHKSSQRQTLHHISDLVFHKLTGIKGVFSTKIAFILVKIVKNRRQYKLVVAGIDGHNEQVLYSSNAPIISPAWSPDGKKIAYAAFEKDEERIYVQDVVTKKRKVVSQYPGANSAPAWSPRGNELALMLTLNGEPKIYTLNLHTNQIKQITTGNAIDTEPCWMPDGKSIIFTSNRKGSPQIYQISLQSGAAERLTHHNNYNAKAAVTPDGKRIVFMTRDRGGDFQIAMQNLVTGKFTQITRSESLSSSPSVAPNGNMLVYATYHRKRGVLVETALDGGVELRLSDKNGAVQGPVWSPFLTK